MITAREVLGSFPIIVNGVMTGTNQLTSLDIDARIGNIGSIQIAWTGTPNGTFTVQIPKSFDAITQQVTAWATLPVTNVAGAALTATGSAGDHQIDLGGVPFPKMRLIYVNSSGTGVLNAWATIKGI